MCSWYMIRITSRQSGREVRGLKIITLEDTTGDNNSRFVVGCRSPPCDLSRRHDLCDETNRLSLAAGQKLFLKCNSVCNYGKRIWGQKNPICRLV